MGLLDFLKPIGKAAAGLVPGGRSVLDVAEAMGGMAGALGKGRADGRVAEANVNAGRDQTALNQYGMQQGSILRAAENMAQQNQTDAQMGLQAPSMRAKQALLGDQMAGFQWKPPTHARANVVDFGSPFNISANTRELGGMLSSGALADQKQGNSPLEKVDFLSQLIAPPGQTPLPKASWLDKILNTAGAVGGIAGAVNGLRENEEPSVANQFALGKAPKVRFGNG